jgi:hypothetical protein
MWQAWPAATILCSTGSDATCPDAYNPAPLLWVSPAGGHVTHVDTLAVAKHSSMQPSDAVHAFYMLDSLSKHTHLLEDM